MNCTVIKIAPAPTDAQYVVGVLMTFIEYRLISKKGEGTFSEVLKAQSVKSNKFVAIKCMKAHFYNIEQVSVTPAFKYQFFYPRNNCAGEQP